MRFFFLFVLKGQRKFESLFLVYRDSEASFLLFVCLNVVFVTP